jgi:hypothetical protein
MKWLKRKLRNWINSEEECILETSPRLRAGNHQFDDDPIRFSVTMARGGVVVTSSVYDRTKDRNYNLVHVIHDDEDVATKVGQIVAMELMKA